MTLFCSTTTRARRLRKSAKESVRKSASVKEIASGIDRKFVIEATLRVSETELEMLVETESVSMSATMKEIETVLTQSKSTATVIVVAMVIAIQNTTATMLVTEVCRCEIGSKAKSATIAKKTAKLTTVKRTTFTAIPPLIESESESVIVKRNMVTPAPAAVLVQKFWKNRARAVFTEILKGIKLVMVKRTVITMSMQAHMRMTTQTESAPTLITTVMHTTNSIKKNLMRDERAVMHYPVTHAHAHVKRKECQTSCAGSRKSTRARKVTKRLYNSWDVIVHLTASMDMTKSVNMNVNVNELTLARSLCNHRLQLHLTVILRRWSLIIMASHLLTRTLHTP